MKKESKILRKSFKNASNMMKEFGFKINSHIKVVINKNLQFLGYIMKKKDDYLIVVSGKTVKSGFVEGLLIHEMSHIYRTETNHPSHNKDLLNEVIHSVIRKHRIKKSYKPIILHQIVRYIQDLYASDISLEIFKKNQDKLFSLDVMANNFLFKWVRAKPAKLNDKTKEKWLNAAMMLKNSLIVSDMVRHKIKDIDNRVKKINEKFLSLVDIKISKESRYFNKFMTSLKEDITEKRFKIRLNEYLENFLHIVK